MRVLLDQDDIGDTVSFRCPECSKCLTCKKYQRSTAVSLQEAWEQVIIEQSMKICKDNNTVITVILWNFLQPDITILIIMIKLIRYTEVNVERVRNRDKV